MKFRDGLSTDSAGRGQAKRGEARRDEAKRDRNEMEMEMEMEIEASSSRECDEAILSANVKTFCSASQRNMA